MENETVELHGELLRFGEVARYMDPVLFEIAHDFERREAAGGLSAQRVLDRYLQLHHARYGEEFVRGELASLW